MEVQNFRCFSSMEMELHPRFNLVVGVNGTGKTAMLEAARIAIGSLFLEMDKYENKIWTPGIETTDVRLHLLEPQYPVNVTCEAQLPLDDDQSDVIGNKYIQWTRTLEKPGGRTTKSMAKPMEEVSRRLQQNVRKGMDFSLPLVAYYSTDRFKKERRDTGITPEGSRLRGYFHALASNSNIKFFLDLYKTETLAELQSGEKSSWLEAVTQTMLVCIPDGKRMYHDVRRDTLLLELHSTQQPIPFYSLSEGVRSMLGLVMELALRCCLLNPHLKEKAPLLTPGVVLIDELDLHLHPSWQKKVIGDLQQAFPAFQFIASTHAPLVIGSLQDGDIFSISDRHIYHFQPQYGRDANAILREMGTEPMAGDLQQDLDAYFLLIEGGKGQGLEAQNLRNSLRNRLGENHPEMERADLLLSFFAQIG